MTEPVSEIGGRGSKLEAQNLEFKSTTEPVLEIRTRGSKLEARNLKLKTRNLALKSTQARVPERRNIHYETIFLIRIYFNFIHRPSIQHIRTGYQK